MYIHNNNCSQITWRRSFGRVITRWKPLDVGNTRLVKVSLGTSCPKRLHSVDIINWSLITLWFICEKESVFLIFVCNFYIFSLHKNLTCAFTNIQKINRNFQAVPVFSVWQHTLSLVFTHIDINITSIEG